MKKQCMCHCHQGSKFFGTKYTLKPKHYKTNYCEACLIGENCEHCSPLPKKKEIAVCNVCWSPFHITTGGATSEDLICKDCPNGGDVSFWVMSPKKEEGG